MEFSDRLQIAKLAVSQIRPFASEVADAMKSSVAKSFRASRANVILQSGALFRSFEGIHEIIADDLDALEPQRVTSGRIGWLQIQQSEWAEINGEKTKQVISSDGPKAFMEDIGKWVPSEIRFEPSRTSGLTRSELISRRIESYEERVERMYQRRMEHREEARGETWALIPDTFDWDPLWDMLINKTYDLFWRPLVPIYEEIHRMMLTEIRGLIGDDDLFAENAGKLSSAAWNNMYLTEYSRQAEIVIVWHLGRYLCRLEDTLRKPSEMPLVEFAHGCPMSHDDGYGIIRYPMRPRSQAYTKDDCAFAEAHGIDELLTWKDGTQVWVKDGRSVPRWAIGGHFAAEDINQCVTFEDCEFAADEYGGWLKLLTDAGIKPEDANADPSIGSLYPMPFPSKQKLLIVRNSTQNPDRTWDIIGLPVREECATVEEAQAAIAGLTVDQYRLIGTTT